MTSLDHSKTSRLASHGYVLQALILRDIRTRMFGSAFGFVFVIGWPLMHILLVIMFFIFSSRLAPFGESTMLWAATGVIPFMCFSYVARFTALGLVSNKPLLYFPKIMPNDIIISRATIEVLNSAVVALVVLVLLYSQGIDVMPRDPAQAAYAMLAALMLGLGFGILNGLIAAMAPSWMTFFMLMIIVLWMTCGIFFVPSHLPEQVRGWLWYHPVLHLTEWMRDAYYDSYSSLILSKEYALLWGAGTLFLSLLAERIFRGSVLNK